MGGEGPAVPGVDSQQTGEKGLPVGTETKTIEGYLPVCLTQDDQGVITLNPAGRESSLMPLPDHTPIYVPSQVFGHGNLSTISALPEGLTRLPSPRTDGTVAKRRESAMEQQQAQAEQTPQTVQTQQSPANYQTPNESPLMPDSTTAFLGETQVSLAAGISFGFNVYNATAGLPMRPRVAVSVLSGALTGASTLITMSPRVRNAVTEYEQSLVRSAQRQNPSNVENQPLIGEDFDGHFFPVDPSQSPSVSGASSIATGSPTPPGGSTEAPDPNPTVGGGSSFIPAAAEHSSDLILILCAVGLQIVGYLLYSLVIVQMRSKWVEWIRQNVTPRFRFLGSLLENFLNTPIFAESLMARVVLCLLILYILATIPSC